MSVPDDPYASPPRDREAAPVRPQQPPAGRPPGPWGPPTGRPADRPAPVPAGRVGTAALVLGLLAVVLGVTVVGGLLLGALAVGLGARGLRGAGGSSGQAVAGIVLGAIGIALGTATWLYVRDDLEEYQGCRKESLSIAEDERCVQELRRGIEGA